MRDLRGVVGALVILVVLAGCGDSVMVRDFRGLHLFAPNLTFVRSVPLPLLGIRDAVELSCPGVVVINGGEIRKLGCRGLR
jgi:hypothetical protein